MDYTILKLAKLAGVSTRTLRYYDEINLLKPARINTSGYRIYSTAEVNLLQQILFYRELDVPLDEIKVILSAENFDFTNALRAHRERLLEKKLQLERLICTDNGCAAIGLTGNIPRKHTMNFQKCMLQMNALKLIMTKIKRVPLNF